MKNVVSNDWKTILVVVIALALCVGYLVNKQNQALVSLLVISGVSYLLNKNVMMSLVVGIAVTSLLVTMNYVKRSEGMTGKPDSRANDKKQLVRVDPHSMAKSFAKKNE
tara:strand:- start:577 stop:903 length:327 start_codon:yes stop_codon:yes gene_type:complete